MQMQYYICYSRENSGIEFNFVYNHGKQNDQIWNLCLKDITLNRHLPDVTWKYSSNKQFVQQQQKKLNYEECLQQQIS